jgi:predicted phage terminase large subunit-like protein
MQIPFCPHTPHPRQEEFLNLNDREVFFGGAAGGGKSDALLMAALLHADQPGYAALILRKDVQRLALAGGLIPRSHEWFAGSDAVWNGQSRQWTFPCKTGPPATLTFGYVSGPFDKYRYASSEFQYIAFDELTEFREEDYLFLFSRLRGVKSLGVPLRVRSASNPGNIGHLWVRQRFIETAAPDRVFIPSRIVDNPSLCEEEYRQSLLYLPPLARERLMNGDWNVQEQGIFRTAWLRYYIETPHQLELFDATGRLLVAIPENTCRRFVTIDPAGTSADKARESRGRAPSWSVVQVWDQPRELAQFLLLRDQVRERVAFDGLVSIVRAVHARWAPQRIWIEDEKLGNAAVSILAREGLPIEVIRTQGRDKVARASDLILNMERGEIFLPKFDNRWRPAFEAELLAWSGHPDQPSDQIDAAAYAAILASQHNPGPIRIERIT